MIIEIKNKNELIAIIIRNDFSQPGTSFITSDDLSLQLACMNHPAGKSITPHFHNPAPREVTLTREVLFIKRGKLRVDFYDRNREYLHSRILESGDVILLVACGHGFETLEEVEMIEVKQGPYLGDYDKTRFNVPDDFVPEILS